jgi:Domain of unknown function (DUF4861)
MRSFMKTTFRLLMPFLLMMSSFVLCAQSPKRLICNNNLSVDRVDELVVVQKKIIETKLGTIANNEKVVFAKADGTPIVLQYDDTDADGVWDEVVFLYSFKAKEKLVLYISKSFQAAVTKAVVRAHVRLRKKNNESSFGSQIISETMPVGNKPTDFSKQPLPLYLTEGPTWENDKVAFRLYFDTRNGKDIFGKRTAKMLMDTVGVHPQNNYHQLADWGMDILHVGKSLGAGALALQFPHKGKDTLMRLGGNEVKEVKYRQIADGPIRGILHLYYKWLIDGKEVLVKEAISIWGGQFFYESQVTLTNAPPQAQLITGIADFNNNEAGQLVGNGVSTLYTHGNQSENKDALGLAIMGLQHQFLKFGKTPTAESDILNTYTYAQKLEGVPLVRRFYAAWVYTNSAFANKKQFVHQLGQEALKMKTPVKVY